MEHVSKECVRYFGASVDLGGCSDLDLSDMSQYTVSAPDLANMDMALMGMPGRWPGRVVRVYAEDAIDPATDTVNRVSVERMVTEGMAQLTGECGANAWTTLFGPDDVIGIKVNCSGFPRVVSCPEVVGVIVDGLQSAGVLPGNIYVFERFASQLATVDYARHLPVGVRVVAADSYLGYDATVFVECQLFDEADCRSEMVQMASSVFTKIVNIPNMKDHGASGVTGCLKNIGYGCFSNVARSHRQEKTSTRSLVGVLAGVEPLRRKTVLQVVDGLRGVWHGGPFSKDDRFLFYPRELHFGTDPVALDRELLELIDAKRADMGAISVWDRSKKYYTTDRSEWEGDPCKNRFIREPDHIRFASLLGLGMWERGDVYRISL